MPAAEKRSPPGRGAAEPRAGERPRPRNSTGPEQESDPGRGVTAGAGRGAVRVDRPSRLKPAEGVPAEEAAVIAAGRVGAAVTPDRIE
ncbi:hypothetical protein B0675_22940 [Streptomyces sp. M41(2017)]|nr:hypothetical protein B0675_22940 [Streptomyces sp. M41(2017)]